MVTPTLISIAVNAKRLLADSELLLSEGRFPSALALAIFAMEEAGKYYLEKWSQEPRADMPTTKKIKKGASYHRHKQAVPTTFDLAEITVTTLKEFLHTKGIPSTEENLRVFAEIFFAAQRRKTEPPFDKLHAMFEEKLVNVAAKRMAESDGAKMQSRAAAGEIEQEKHSGLYVDVSETGEVLSDPAVVTEERAEYWISEARKAVARLP